MNYVEVYGFILWITSCLATVIWLLWAFCPDSLLKDYLGLWFVPDRWWAVALPTEMVVLFYAANAIYFGMSLANTQPLDSRDLISDSSTPVHNKKDEKHDIEDAHDIPLRYVNKVMYEISPRN